jgi:hypothetical protein
MHAVLSELARLFSGSQVYFITQMQEWRVRIDTPSLSPQEKWHIKAGYLAKRTHT